MSENDNTTNRTAYDDSETQSGDNANRRQFLTKVGTASVAAAVLNRTVAARGETEFEARPFSITPAARKSIGYPVAVHEEVPITRTVGTGRDSDELVMDSHAVAFPVEGIDEDEGRKPARPAHSDPSNGMGFPFVLVSTPNAIVDGEEQNPLITDSLESILADDGKPTPLRAQTYCGGPTSHQVK